MKKEKAFAEATKGQDKDKKKSAIARLRELYLTEHYKKYPNFPEYGKSTPAFSDKSANGLTKCVLTWLRLSSWQAERVANMGRMIDKSKIVYDCIGKARKIGSAQWIPGSGTCGTSDIHAVIGGRAVKIEIKAGADRQSEAQKEYQRKVEAAGGVYIIAHTFSEFLEWYDKFLKVAGNG